MSTGPAATATPQPTVDPQDPLPESKWVYRRWLSIVIIVFVGWQLHLIGNRIARQTEATAVIDALVNLAHWLIVGWAITMVLYMVAPSAEQVAKMLATLAAWRSGISTTSTSRAVAPDGSMAEATTSAGKPAPKPPVGEDLGT